MTNLQTSYDELLAAKTIKSNALGFDAIAAISKIHRLFPFQKYGLRQLLKRGRAGGFLAAGLGKTDITLAGAMIEADHNQKPSLIMCPLGVTGQFIEEAALFPGMEICRMGHGNAPIQVTNFAKLHRVDNPGDYGSVWLDEGSILKNETGATKNALCETFAVVPHRYSMSATPAPNDHTEIGCQAEFLGIMTMQSMLSRWFVHDSAHTQDWRLKGHAREAFWRWVRTWAVACRKPSDWGFSDDGYILPALLIHRVIVETPVSDNALFHTEKLSAMSLHKDKRRTVSIRAAKIAEIVNSKPDTPWCIWADTDYEADEIKATLPGIVEIRGSLTDEVKEKRSLDFSHGKIPKLLTKPRISGFGSNWQVCADTVLPSNYSFEMWKQILWRFHRYGQTQEVNAYVVCADSEWSLIEAIDKKTQEYEEGLSEMVKFMNDEETKLDTSASLAGHSDDMNGPNWRMMGGDCVQRIKEIPDASVGYSIFSPPFASLYVYSDAPEDMGNSANDAEFFEHFGYLVPELRRVMMPGRLVSIHCMDLPSIKERDGVIGLRDFPGEIIRLFTQNGFIFHSRVTIWKNPLIAAVRTKALGLLHKQLLKDSAISRQGCADYLITMRVPGINPVPVTHGNGFSEYIGIDDPVDGIRSHEIWQRYASPVWMDIDPGKVLPYTGAKSEQDERHICPLQRQVVSRGIELWSNPGETVFTPFGGVGTEPYEAVLMGRFGLGIELKKTYLAQAVTNLRSANASKQLDLFGDGESLPENWVGINMVEA